MASLIRRTPGTLSRLNVVRSMSTTPASTTTSSSSSSSTAASTSDESQTPNTHFKITLRRSGISLGKKVQGTLLALGFHRRNQTVYHAHGPEVAGKILRVKELLEVENVPQRQVMNKEQQREARKATRGYKVVGSRKDNFMKV